MVGFTASLIRHYNFGFVWRNLSLFADYFDFEPFQVFSHSNEITNHTEQKSIKITVCALAEPENHHHHGAAIRIKHVCLLRHSAAVVGGLRYHHITYTIQHILYAYSIRL